MAFYNDDLHDLQLFMWSGSVRWSSSIINGTPRIYTVVGYICETDTFAWDRKINEIHEGDILAFHNAGAYGFTMSSNYNSRIRPAEVMLHQGKNYLIRKRETIDDILKNQIEVEM